MGNYTPISILSSFSKIIEKILTERLSKFWEINNILYKQHYILYVVYGFRKSFSTKLAIIMIIEIIACIEQIQNALDKGMLAMGIYLYLSKAFNTVNNKILKEKK